MGMILKDSIQKLMKGYPTVSDKYNVKGGILTGTTPAHFGDLVKFSGTTGYYEVATSGADIAGICLATNVKLATEWPGTDDSVVVRPGEAFNLFLDGYVAVEVEEDDYNDIVEGATVTISSTAKFGTSGTEIDAVYTGVKEQRDGKCYAEIHVRSFKAI